VNGFLEGPSRILHFYRVCRIPEKSEARCRRMDKSILPHPWHLCKCPMFSTKNQALENAQRQISMKRADRFPALLARPEQGDMLACQANSVCPPRHQISQFSDNFFDYPSELAD
jgi:hypothetical protein